MTTTPDLYFQKIHIRRMPGFPDGGFPIRDLCPGVNIIYGPNASGKTTLSRAIQKLLCPHEPPHESRSLVATIHQAGETLTIDYDLGRTHCQRDGFDEDCPSLAPPETGDRYVLALHDLIRSEDGSDLAAEIVRESAGGYDVNAAKGSLEFRDRPSGKGSTYRDLETAIGNTREARRRQEELRDKERELTGLRRQKEEAQRAADEIEWLDKAIKYQEARANHQEATTVLQTFPEGLRLLTGREVEDLDRLEELLEEARGRLTKARLKAEAAEKQLAASALPDDGVPSGLVHELRLKCQKLRQQADNIDAKKQQRAEAQEKALLARQALGSQANQERLTGWNADIVSELAKFARRAERTRAQKSASDSLAAWLGVGADEEPPGDPENLHQGIRLLYRWLAYEDREVIGIDSKIAWLVAAGVTAVTSIAMAFLVHWSWIVLLIVAAGLSVWAFWPRREADHRAAIRREFGQLGVASLDRWTDEAVRVALGELQRRLAAAALDQEKSIRRRHLETRSEKVLRDVGQLEKDRHEWAERLGVPIDSENFDETWLYYLVEHGVDYQKAGAAARAADKSLELAKHAYDSSLSDINEAIRTYGYQPAADPERVSRFVEDLDQRARSHESACETIDDTQEAIEQIEQEIERWETERSGLFEQAGLGPDQEPTLREWVRMYPEYVTAAENLRHAQRDCEVAKAALSEHGELTRVSKDELVEMRRNSQDLANTLEQLNLQIGGIETDISNAKRASDLEAALAVEAECTEALRQQRNTDYDLVAGHVLAEFLATRQRDRERPVVFKRAQKLFVKITHGHFRLDIEESEPPAFRAFDTRQQRGLALDELSSGTRLQLLLAVKLAFIERQEQGAKLPFILDETLANSDERRARQIIDAVIEFCRSGRQVFYLTAQYDEVGKWKQILAEKGSIPSKLINLADVRGIDGAECAIPVVIAFPAIPQVPPPEGLSWLEYGQQLQVRAHDLRSETGRIHLWYLVDDLSLLHQLLTQDIITWGQLKTLVQHASVDSLGADSALYRRAEARVRLLEAVARYWQIGRGRPVDRQVLIDSGAVSDTFIDRVSDLATRLDGEAGALLAALDSGEIKGFRGDKRNDLAEHLKDTGYLDDREAMTSQQICEQVRAVAFTEIQKGLIDVEQLEHLLAVVLHSSRGLPR